MRTFEETDRHGRVPVLIRAIADLTCAVASPTRDAAVRVARASVLGTSDDLDGVVEAEDRRRREAPGIFAIAELTDVVVTPARHAVVRQQGAAVRITQCELGGLTADARH